MSGMLLFWAAWVGALSTPEGFQLLQLYQGPGSATSTQTHVVWGTNKKNQRHAHACMGVIPLPSQRRGGVAPVVGAAEWKAAGFSWMIGWGDGEGV